MGSSLEREWVASHPSISLPTYLLGTSLEREPVSVLYSQRGHILDASWWQPSPPQQGCGSASSWESFPSIMPSRGASGVSTSVSGGEAGAQWHRKSAALIYHPPDLPLLGGWPGRAGCSFATHAPFTDRAQSSWTLVPSPLIQVLPSSFQRVA